MTRKSKLAGITLVAALAAPSFAVADHHRGKHGHSGRMLDRIEMWDSDGNGEVTQDEVNGVRTERLNAFDADGNGTVNLAEYEALWLDAMRERMVDMFQRHDDDGDGEITADEFSEDFRRMVQRMDRNGDGVLSADDAEHHARRGGRDDDESPSGN